MPGYPDNAPSIGFEERDAGSEVVPDGLEEGKELAGIAREPYIG
jgi:hypothetical protein